MKIKNFKNLFRKTPVKLLILYQYQSLALSCLILGNSCNECNPDSPRDPSSATSFPAKTDDVHCCTLTVSLYNTGSSLRSQLRVLFVLLVAQRASVKMRLSVATELINDNKFFLYFLSLSCFVGTFIFTTTRLTQLKLNFIQEVSG